MSCPRNRIVPEVGLSRPVMQLTKVVLPAPLGPMTPRISPLPMVRSTPPTAARPPKRLVMERASRSGAAPEGGRRKAGGGPDPEPTGLASAMSLTILDRLPPAACRLTSPHARRLARALARSLWVREQPARQTAD